MGEVKVFYLLYVKKKNLLSGLPILKQVDQK
jgi:hypothetical protein